MKKLVIILMLLSGFAAPAQQVMTRNGYIGFFSKTPLEDIKAETSQANAAVDLAKQTLAFAVLVKGFLFTKELMQAHFNENYVESDKFPKATFSGTYAGNVDVTKPGTYPVQVKGNLTLHGVTKTIDVPATFQVQTGSLTGKASFSLKPEDFAIKIPSLVREKIAPQIAVTINVSFPLSN
jgi:polyisoprenoid-binding protein YceI